MKICQMLLFFSAISLMTLLKRSSSNQITFSDDSHPMLYYSAKDLIKMRVKADTTHEKIVKYIREATQSLVSNPPWYLPPEDSRTFAGVWNEHYGNRLCAFSLFSAIYPDSDERLLDLLKKYMDRMAAYPDWYVKNSHGEDQVPIGHSLTGFATAYDFLYDRLDHERREKYYGTIQSTTEYLHNLLTKGRFGWTREYIHNHAPSNLVALLLGALVVSAHEPDLAAPWIKQVKQHMDFAMELFSYVSDGSVDEGVSYGTYTSRGVTQYVFLSLRHLDTDHTSNPWLEQHFWFLYKTILPGYQRAVGIADANYNWFYGPESQLVFLDAYVMKNGYGNWLADRIRESRPKEKPLGVSPAQIWSTLHTEFLFYNSSIVPRKPVENPAKKIHIFSDWGVVTYGGGQDANSGNSFLSFKSSVPNGDAMEEMLYSEKYPTLITGWRNFNPGHEHPDQNSFIFVPNGRYFVSEALYGPKFTWLNNAVVFSPSDTSNCYQPWEGQIGECDKWLRFKKYTKGARAEILTASTSGEMIFTAGEAVGVYSKSLGLQSVYRGILLLNPEVLIVVDSIRLRPGGKTKKASAFFHNVWTKFEPYQHLGHSGAQVIYPEGAYTVFSMSSGRGNINTTLHNGVQPAGLREGPTNYVNVTFDLQEDVTNVVHVFSGPNYHVNSAVFQPVSEISGVFILFDINGQEYKANIATFVRSTSRNFDPTRERKRITGFGGFAQVRAGLKNHFFGFDERPLADEQSETLGNDPVQKFLRIGGLKSLSENRAFAILGGQTKNRPEENDFVSSNDRRKRSDAPLHLDSMPLRLQHGGRNWPVNYGISYSNFLPLIFVGIFATMFFRNSRGKSWTKSLRENKAFSLCVILLVCLTIENTICINYDGKNTCFGDEKIPHEKSAEALRGKTAKELLYITSATVESAAKVSFPTSPFVLLTSLPGAGGDLVEEAFEESNMTLYLSSSEMSIPEGDRSKRPDLCLWPVDDSESHLYTMGWLKSLKSKPRLHFNQETSSDLTNSVKHRLRENFNTPTVLNDKSGFWMTKVPWLRNVVGKESLQPVVFVRDPRSWIHMLISEDSDARKAETLEHLVNSFDVVEEICSGHGTVCPHYFRHSRMLQNYRSLITVEKLATIWTISTASMLVNEANDSGQWPLQVVRFEDILRNPEAAMIDMFFKLGLPLGLRSLSKIRRVVNSGLYSIPFDGPVTPRISTLWKNGLSRSDIDKIETMCCDFMRIVGYECG